MNLRPMIGSALATMLVSTSVYAQDTSKVAAAEALFVEAEQLEANGQHELACGKYAESLQLDPGLGTLLHLAQCYEHAGKLASAWGRYREALELAVRAGDPRSEIARQRADALEPKLTKLVISVDPASQVPGLSIVRNGVAVGAPQWNVALPIDPGEHVVVATAHGYLPQQLKVSATSGTRELRVRIPKLAPAPHAEEGESSAGSGAAQRIVGVTLAGTGAAALIAGGVLGITAKTTYDGADCAADNRCSVDGLDTRSSAFSQAAASTVLMIAGGALVAGGAVLFFTAPRHATPRATARFGVSPGGVVLRGTF